MKQIIVSCLDGRMQVALLEERLLTEYYVERPQSKSLAGGIYKGKVVDVLPGMQAAFVDIGLEKNAFLYVDDMLPAHPDKRPAVKPSIEKLVRPGQELVVQIAKEPIGTKGARITTHFSFPGRWVVYMPDAGYIGISRKIEAEEERLRLRKLAERLLLPGEGVIMRTVARSEQEEAIAADLAALREQWSDIRRKADRQAAPSSLFREPGVLERIVRDTFNDGVDELVIDSPKEGEALIRHMRRISGELADRVRIYRGAEPVQDAYRIREQLDRAMKRKIWLDNGGYLIWDRTEALTVIDVNTGKYTGTDDAEETVFTTNLEAAETIARLLRLRDVGGIVLVDFIDMASDAHRAAVADRLEQAFRLDRTKSIAVGWTKLGLMEITRKKARESLDQTLFAPCPTCGRAGMSDADGSHYGHHGRRGSS